MLRAEVFAVDDASVQVCWRAAPPGRVEVGAGDAAASTTSDGGPGGVVVGGLRPGQRLRVTVQGSFVEQLHTLVPPPGRELCRFAAINDLHIGATEFGPIRAVREADHRDPHPLRCARAAIHEALAWGAEALVVKGDLTQEGRPNEWCAVAALLARAGVPVFAIEGNHETKRSAIDGRRVMARSGLELHVHPAALDLPGVRIVGVPTPRWHGDPGWVTREAAEQSAALAAGAPAAVMALHHYPQRFLLPTLYPPGIPGPIARRSLDAWRQANPNSLVIAGHTHRHRRREYHGLVIAESGSTKDFPGTWTGYVVYEGGIMQVTRRVLAPAAIAWSERGRAVLGGLWGLWSPGLRSHRCFSHTWPRAAACA
ncbi:MAG TPA: metallophosphoesterase [Acidimicrobiales bacterium]|nr:metallophosphoesterase [Acidimicrobiales bacterium]